MNAGDGRGEVPLSNQDCGRASGAATTITGRDATFQAVDPVRGRTAAATRAAGLSAGERAFPTAFELHRVDETLCVGEHDGGRGEDIVSARRRLPYDEDDYLDEWDEDDPLRELKRLDSDDEDRRERSKRRGKTRRRGRRSSQGGWSGYSD